MNIKREVFPWICRNLKGTGRCAKIKVITLLENGHGILSDAKISVNSPRVDNIFTNF